MYRVEIFEDGESIGFVKEESGLPYGNKAVKEYADFDDADWYGETLCEELDGKSWNGEMTYKVVETSYDINRDILEKYRLTKMQLALRFAIPYKTIQNWTTKSETAKRKCPEYVIKMMIEILENDHR